MIIWILVVIFSAAAICAVRVVLGPTAPDRVVAVDGIAAMMVATLVILGVYYHATFYLDVALVYALIFFLGTLAVAKYLEGRGVET